MNKLLLALAISAAGAIPALAADNPVFAAECAGGVNQGGYNIDTDDRGHLWVNGHRVPLHAAGEDNWEGSYHGVTFGITSTESGLIVSWTGRNRANGICTVVAQ